MRKTLISQVIKNREIDESFIKSKLVWGACCLFFIVFFFLYFALLIGSYSFNEWKLKQGLASIIKPERNKELVEYLNDNYKIKIKEYLDELAELAVSQSEITIKDIEKNEYLIKGNEIDNEKDYTFQEGSTKYIANKVSYFTSDENITRSQPLSENSLSILEFSAKKLSKQVCSKLKKDEAITESSFQAALDDSFKPNEEDKDSKVEINSAFNDFKIKKVFYYGNRNIRFAFPGRALDEIPDIEKRMWFKLINKEAPYFCDSTCPLFQSAPNDKVKYLCDITNPYTDIEPIGGITRTVICKLHFTKEANEEPEEHYIGFDLFFHFGRGNTNIKTNSELFEYVFMQEWGNAFPKDPYLLMLSVLLSLGFMMFVLNTHSVGRIVEVKKIASAKVQNHIKKTSRLKLLMNFIPFLKDGSESFFESVKEKQSKLEFLYENDKEDTSYYQVIIKDVKELNVLFFSRRFKSMYDEGVYSVSDSNVENLINANELRLDIKKLLILNRDKDEYIEHVLHDNVIRDSIDNFHQKIRKTNNFTIAVSNFASLQYGEFRFINGKGLMKEVLELGRVQVYAVTNEQAIRNIISFYLDVLSNNFAEGDKRESLKCLLLDWFFKYTSIRIIICHSLGSLKTLLGDEIFEAVIEKSMQKQKINNKSLYVYEKYNKSNSESVEDEWLDKDFIKHSTHSGEETDEKSEKGLPDNSLGSLKDKLKDKVKLNGSMEDFAILQSTGQNKEYIGLMTADYQSFRLRSRIDKSIPINSEFNFDDLEISYSGTLYTSNTYVIPYKDYYKSLLKESILMHLIDE
ncbi:hypothetical protein L2737_08810 [Shewanella electrodiphila]|uniref:Uncharacterized protein n=1 Tax=Shewanella electrodiphila TaxID=934143 RepID=A0ABT0KPZ0_9GAMM|nr:hypothetical protein [Shewanella electrodiphila]MCL1045425.1 hypothetical protein [Shewanella electrodiphila]